VCISKIAGEKILSYREVRKVQSERSFDPHIEHHSAALAEQSPWVPVVTSQVNTDTYADMALLCLTVTELLVQARIGWCVTNAVRGSCRKASFLLLCPLPEAAHLLDSTFGELSIYEVTLHVSLTYIQLRVSHTEVTEPLQPRGHRRLKEIF
jgi:hypothetical protein